MSVADTTIFESQAQDYDSWFDNHPELFQNEYMALKKAIPDGIGIELGVGTGRFADVLKIPVGVEPAHAMAQMAVARGITVINAKAEELPFHSLSFDYAIMITTDCFLDNISKAFSEAYRIIKKNGFFIVAMIDKDSELGKQYQGKKTTSIWYKDAHFHSVHEITDQLQQAGFTNFEYWQTLFTNTEELSEPLPGFGKGGFVVIRSQKI
ncbi:MAG: class I SAM-dependent methyltransferase [Chitinophagaceae bacterium]|nr:class I SAM-dependent methyltransferase [Chitinophagaceae bacterium]